MTTTWMTMTSSAPPVSTADARREAQRRRIMADRLDLACPKCEGDRVFKQAGIGNKDKAICYDCGGRFRRKT